LGDCLRSASISTRLALGTTTTSSCMQVHWLQLIKQSSLQPSVLLWLM
jgi:hypothetical protein